MPVTTTLHRLPRRVLRRSTAALAATVLVSVPLLASCGFNAATDRVNTIAPGINDRTGQVDVLGAVVVGTEDGSGTFVATLSNNDLTPDSTDTLQSLAGSGDTSDIAVTGVLRPIPVKPGAAVSMIKEDKGVPVTGSFVVGNFVTVTLGFSSGQSSTLTVPVVRPCFQYGGITAATQLPDPDPTPTPSSILTPYIPTDVPTEVQTDGGNDDPYSCAEAVRPTETPAP